MIAKGITPSGTVHMLLGDSGVKLACHITARGVSRLTEQEAIENPLTCKFCIKKAPAPAPAKPATDEQAIEERAQLLVDTYGYSRKEAEMEAKVTARAAAEPAKVELTAINRGNAEVQVHKAGCAHLKKDIRGASIWSITAASLQDITEDVAGDFIAENEGTTWEDYTGEFKLMNCCPELPYTADGQPPAAAPAPVAAPAPTGRKNSKQAEIILAFFEGRDPGAAYTPHQISKATGHAGLRDACARLAAQGALIRTDDKPATYRIAG